MQNHNPMPKLKLNLPNSSHPKQAHLPPNPKQQKEDLDEELKEGEFQAIEPKQNQDDKSKVEEEEIVEMGPKKRVCDVCFKEFNGGKALGGHLRIHNNSKGSSSKKASKKLVAPNSPNSSPRSDVGGPFKCPELDCHKNFKSEKCLHGHMRSHPDRPYRGMPPPSDEDDFNSSAQPLRPPKWRGLVKKKRGWPLVGVDEGSSSSSFNPQDEVTAAAELTMLGANDLIVDVKKSIPREERLKMIQRGEFDEDEKYFLQDYLGISIPPHLDLHPYNKMKRITEEVISLKSNTHKKRKVITGSGSKRVNNDEVAASMAKANADGKWPCHTCGKAFLTYQALGGHMSSHNKDKSANHKKEKVSLISHPKSYCNPNLATAPIQIVDHRSGLTHVGSINSCDSESGSESDESAEKDV